MRHIFSTTAVLGCATLFAGCAAGPDYVRPADALPKSYTAQTPAAAGEGAQTLDTTLDIPAQWWQLFHSPALNELITASLQHNPTMEAAQAALRQAQENVSAQQGAFYPSVDTSYAPTRQKVAGTLSSPLASNAYYYNLHTAQVTVSYVPDLFGANRRQVESLQAQAQSQRYQLEATRLTLTSNVANAAIQEAMLRAQIGATREMVSAQTTLLAMFRKQFDLGQVAQADVAAQPVDGAGRPLPRRRRRRGLRSRRIAAAGHAAVDAAGQAGRTASRRARRRGGSARGQRADRRGRRKDRKSV